MVESCEHQYPVGCSECPSCELEKLRARRKVFKWTMGNTVSPQAVEHIRRSWERIIEDTDLAGAKLIIIEDGCKLEELSEGMLLQDAAAALEAKGRRELANELRAIIEG